MLIDIAEGNHHNLFDLYQNSEWTAQVRTTTSLRGRHGNYTLIVRAQDLGKPSFLVEEPLHICVADYNDHAPVFVAPPHNSTLRIPEVRFRREFCIRCLTIDFIKYLFYKCLCVINGSGCFVRDYNVFVTSVEDRISLIL